MTTRIPKEERSQQLTWNYKTWECSSTDSSDGKGRFLRISFLMLLLVLVWVSPSLKSFSGHFYSPISYSFTSPTPHASLHILPPLHPLTILPIPKTTILTIETRQWHTLFILVYHVRYSHYNTSTVFLLSISSNIHNHFPISLNFYIFFKVHW